MRSASPASLSRVPLSLSTRTERTHRTHACSFTLQDATCSLEGLQCFHIVSVSPSSLHCMSKRGERPRRGWRSGNYPNCYCLLCCSNKWFRVFVLLIHAIFMVVVVVVVAAVFVVVVVVACCCCRYFCCCHHRYCCCDSIFFVVRCG